MSDFSEGAQQAFATLRNFEAWAENQCNGVTGEEYLARRQSVLDAAMEPLDGLSDYQRGYVVALLETLEFCFTTGTPNLKPGSWIPDAMMTAEQLSNKHQEIVDLYSEIA